MRRLKSMKMGLERGTVLTWLLLVGRRQKKADCEKQHIREKKRSFRSYGRRLFILDLSPKAFTGSNRIQEKVMPQDN